MKNLFFLSICVFLLSFVSCKEGNKEKKSKNGYLYTLYETGKGDKVKAGDLLTFDIIVFHKDSVLQDSKKNPSQPEILYPADSLMTTPNAVIDALGLMKVGDSIKIVEKIDSFKHLPPQMKGWKELTYKITLKSIKTAAEIQKVKDLEKGISAFLKTNVDAYNAKTIKDLKTTPTGLKYVILEEGQGELIKSGEVASVHYLGVEVASGKVFDASFRQGMPFKFQVGGHQVIPGWDEGATLLKKGSKAILFIPAALAYGKDGIKDAIAPNAELAFYMDVQK